MFRWWSRVFAVAVVLAASLLGGTQSLRAGLSLDTTGRARVWRGRLRSAEFLRTIGHLALSAIGSPLHWFERRAGAHEPIRLASSVTRIGVVVLVAGVAVLAAPRHAWSQG